MKWTIVLIVLAGVFAAGDILATPLPCDCLGGFDQYGYWYLLDFFGTPLQDGDWVYSAWVGPDGQIDPPGLDGLPLYDDEVHLSAGALGGEIEYGMFFITCGTWDIGDVDSLGNQRHPIAGDLIYCRIFDGPRGSIGPGNYYGDSQTYACIHEFAERFYCLFPGDPGGGHTDTPIAPTAVELMSFSAIARDGQVLLEWTTASEVDNLGFHLHRNGRRVTVEIIPAGGGSESGQTYTYLDRGLDNGATYYYDLISVDRSGLEEVLNEKPLVATPKAVVPQAFVLQQNYPNPFNPVTEIEYHIPLEGHVTLKVYDIRGAEVATLVDRDQEPGRHTVRWGAEGLASGVYFCTLTAGDVRAVRKMVLLK